MNNFYLRIFTSLFLLPLIIYIIYIKNLFYYLLLILVFFFSIKEVKFLFRSNKNFLFLIFFLIIIFIYSLNQLRGSTSEEFYYLLWGMSIIWLTDIGGFFVGKFFKGPHFSKWSPNKTVSGLIGSIIFSQFAFLEIFIFLNKDFNYIFFLIQLIVCIVAILGDLFFSYIKRKNNIKDYSNLIPGHGGLLDRIDGLIFGIIVFYFFKLVYAF